MLELAAPGRIHDSTQSFFADGSSLRSHEGVLEV
jgi:hypothetical protein